jgi:hypothetical protein
MGRMPYDGLREAARIEASSVARARVEIDAERRESGQLTDKQREDLAGWGFIPGTRPHCDQCGR